MWYKRVKEYYPTFILDMELNNKSFEIDENALDKMPEDPSK
jgi:hypothetical protein